MRAFVLSVLMAATAIAADQQNNPYASTYQPPATRPTVIRNATILTAAGPVIDNGAVLLQNGKVAAVGRTVNAPADALAIGRELARQMDGDVVLEPSARGARFALWLPAATP